MNAPDPGKTPVVRIAPSPTGNLHVGTARTALFNFLFARKHRGTFILRIEDTDRERSTQAFEDNILSGLAWLGLDHDAFYRQSERSEIYREALERLVEAGKAYVSEETGKDDPERSVAVVRLRNPGREVVFEDIVRGSISFDTAELKDFVIARSMTEPLYHFAVVVDDALMGVTHVIRGEDHISNTPRQILIQEALGYERPRYAHIPLILAPDRSKLSKRAGAVSVDEYRAAGYLPEALVNYLALLGWSPEREQEIFTLEELVESFTLEQIHKGGAIFSRDKLDWFNREHIARLAPERFRELAETFLPEEARALPQYSPERLKSILPLLRERIARFDDVRALFEAGELAYFFDRPSYDPDSLSFKREVAREDIREHLTTLLDALEAVPDDQFGAETVKAAIWEYATEVGRGAVLWPFRYALSGRDKSPDPFTLAEILGKEEALARLRHAQQLCS